LHDFRKKKVIERKIYVLIFFTTSNLLRDRQTQQISKLNFDTTVWMALNLQFLSETYLFIRRNE